MESNIQKFLEDNVGSANQLERILGVTYPTALKYFKRPETIPQVLLERLASRLSTENNPLRLMVKIVGEGEE